MRAALMAFALIVHPVVAAARPVVVELYTSEACSSCPPAESLLGELGRDPSVIPLAFHVDYWNSSSWRDPYASAASTERQRRVAARNGTYETYTPEMVVDGGSGFVGSDRRTALDQIAVASGASPDVTASLTREGDELVVSVGAGKGTGALHLYGTDDHVRRAIAGGENAGATLTEFAVVRSVVDLGGWTGRAMSLRVPRPAGDGYAVVLEGADGRVLAAARLAGQGR